MLLLAMADASGRSGCRSITVIGRVTDEPMVLAETCVEVFEEIPYHVRSYVCVDAIGNGCQKGLIPIKGAECA